MTQQDKREEILKVYEEELQHTTTQYEDARKAIKERCLLKLQELRKAI